MQIFVNIEKTQSLNIRIKESYKYSVNFYNLDEKYYVF